jgi:hypothetical protein
MTLTENQIRDLREAAKPLMDWLLNNCHPHTTAIVDSQIAEVFEGVANVHRKELSTIVSSNPLQHPDEY